MSADFDPYHKWLGIPREEQPPNLYRLLGLRLFEPDPDVIANASDQRMALLKNFAIGQHGALSEDLLNEVARAKVWLLNPAKRLSYDKKLRDQLGGLPPESTPADSSPELQTLHAVWDSASQKQSSIARPESIETPQITVRQQGSISNGAHTQDGGQLPTSLAPISKAATAPRRATTRGLSTVLFFLISAITGFIGLAAGYFVLCVIDIHYDFLHLLTTKQSKTSFATEKREQAAIIPPRNRTIPKSAPPGEPFPLPPPDRHSSAQPPPHRLPVQPEPPGPRPTPPLQRRVDPFGNFPSELPIPISNLFQDPTPLASVPMQEISDFDLSLVRDATSEGSGLSIVRDPKDNDQRNWLVRQNQDETKSVANFGIKDDELAFKWFPGQSRATVTALRNSVLRIQANGYDRFVSLREPIAIERYTIDLLKSFDRPTCDCDDLPEPATLRLDILDVAVGGDFRVDRNGTLGMKLGDDAKIHFNNIEELSIRVMFTKSVNGNQLAVEFKPRYHLPSRPKEELEFKGSSLKLKYLRKLGAEKKDDAKVQADLQALERVAKLAEALHEKATIKYRFYSLMAGHVVVLASTP